MMMTDDDDPANVAFAALIQDSSAIRAILAKRLDFSRPTRMVDWWDAGILVHLYILLVDDLDPTVRAAVRANPTVPPNARDSVDALFEHFDAGRGDTP